LRTSDLARAYFAKAEADLRDAERALRDGSHSTCVFFCQQAVERALKSILAAEGVETRTRHVSKVVMAHLDRFEKLGGPLLRVLRRASEVSEMLEPHVGRARYPWREGTKVMSPRGVLHQGDRRALPLQGEEGDGGLQEGAGGLPWWARPVSSELEGARF
jgi:HEPN domain-containing protein